MTMSLVKEAVRTVRSDIAMFDPQFKKEKHTLENFK